MSDVAPPDGALRQGEPTPRTFAFRSGDALLLNGAALRFRCNGEAVSSKGSRILVGRQVMAPEEAVTPARRLYLAIQFAYVCEPEDFGACAAVVRDRAADYAQATTSRHARGLVEQVLSAFEAGRCTEAMRLVRRLFVLDDAVLTRAAPARGG